MKLQNIFAAFGEGEHWLRIDNCLHARRDSERRPDSRQNGNQRLEDDFPDFFFVAHNLFKLMMNNLLGLKPRIWGGDSRSRR